MAEYASESTLQPSGHPGLAITILIGVAVLFNAALAAINAHITPVSTALVAACEVAIILAIHAICIVKYKSHMLYFYSMFVPLIMFLVFRSLAVETPAIKPLRDVLIILTFLIGGSLVSEGQLRRLIITLHSVVLIFLSMEAIDVMTFSWIFDIKQYYINTRGFSEESFFNKESSLFVSATRPDERFLPFFGLHRMSSVFLEPPSLGNYCIIVFAYTFALSSRLQRAQWMFLVIGSLATLFASDSRLATGTVAAMGLAAGLQKFLPRPLHVIYVPLTLCGIFIAYHALDWSSGTDDLIGRTAYSVEYMEDMGIAALSGVSKEQPTFDSGYAYIIASLSLPAAALLWFWLIAAPSQGAEEFFAYRHCLWIYLSLNLVVSNASFSIKTAAVLWAIYGALRLQSAGGHSRADSASRRLTPKPDAPNAQFRV